jgi:hypothetical protein
MFFRGGTTFTFSSWRSKIRIKGRARATHHWWAHSLVKYGESGGDSMVLTELLNWYPTQLNMYPPCFQAYLLMQRTS